MTHVSCRLTAKNRDQLWNPTLGNRVWATFTFVEFGIEFQKKYHNFWMYSNVFIRYSVQGGSKNKLLIFREYVNKTEKIGGM